MAIKRCIRLIPASRTRCYLWKMPMSLAGRASVPVLCARLALPGKAADIRFLPVVVANIALISTLREDELSHLP